MSDRPRVLVELGAELDRVARETLSSDATSRQRSVARRHWWRWRAAPVLLAVLLGGAAVAFASGLFSFGAPVAATPVFSDAQVGLGAVVPGSVRLLAIATPDPQGGPAWGLRVLSTTRGAGCVQVGRLVDGKLVALGQDGAFDNDGRAHALPVSAAINTFSCTLLDTKGQFVNSVTAVGQTASAAWWLRSTNCVPTGTPQPLSLIHIYQPPRGRLLATRDGGPTWRTIAATPFVGPIDFTTASDGWGVAGPVGSVSTGALPATVTGALYHTTNGGRSWQRQSICTTTSTSGTFTDCGTPRFFARRIGVLPVTTVDRHAGRAALTVERTTNGGRTWSGTRLPSVPATPSMRYGSGQAGKFVAISATNWIALVGPRLYETTDAGSRWTTLAPKPDLPASRVFELDFTSARAGWVLADPVSSDANAQPIFDYTINSGRTWHPLARQ